MSFKWIRSRIEADKAEYIKPRYDVKGQERESEKQELGKISNSISIMKTTMRHLEF